MKDININKDSSSLSEDVINTLSYENAFERFNIDFEVIEEQSMKNK